MIILTKENYCIGVVYMDKKNISVKILNIKTGLTEYDNAKFIKIKSKKYNLLIMQDYLPIIGEIEGSIRIEFTDNFIEFNNISGYFMNKKNQFNLFIRKEGSPDAQIALQPDESR